MDSITASKSRLEYAKVCIEIGTKDELPETVEVMLTNGTTTTIFVDIPWFPSRCRRCNTFGHSDKGCLAKTSSAPTTTKIWRIKNNHNENFDLNPQEKSSMPIPLPDPSLQNSLPDAIPLKDHTVSNGKEQVNEPGNNNPIQKPPYSAPITNNSIIKPKRGRGRPLKNTSKFTIRGSTNRFEILSTVDESSSSEIQPRKARTATVGVAKLIKELKSKKKDHINEIKRNWNIINNYDSAVNGRIWLLWKIGIDLTHCYSIDQSITVKCLSNNTYFIITAIYGSNSGSQRRSLWQHLKFLDSMYGSQPWILGGDFNTYLHHKESSDSLLLGPYSTTDMIDFQEIVQDLSLQDHPFFGPTFSWSNKQKETYLARKLDRLLINPPWASSFQGSFVEFLAPGPSDHSMAMVWTSKETQTNRPKPFKFFNFWTKHPNYLEVVQSSWQLPIHGNPLQKLFLKLKRLKPCLNKLNKDNYNDISARVRLKRTELEQIQISILNLHNSIEKELTVQKELFALEDNEFMFLKQKAKVRWIKDGDKCTKLFHTAIASKFKRDTIRVLINNEGKRLESYDEMANETSSEFTKTVSVEEIKEALFIQGNDKAPGPDGFTPMFFKNSWSVVGEVIINVVLYYFQEAKIPPAFNSTIIALIPKIQNPSKVKDYRPISCCVVIYKIIKKILVKRLSLLLPDLITLNQTAFVKGRSIMDNTLLAQELVKGYGFFKGQRGIRQVGPLSPILFVMTMNILSKILNLVAARGNLESNVGVTTVLNHFYTLSGLNLNINKTEFFAVDISIGTLDSIKSATGFKHGFLPIRYLGVPLVTKKLSETDFPYSQKVINRLEQSCARFLRKGSNKPAKGARISWNRIFCPKSE
ncbi:uncharacterized protein LOC120120892 [Hibiscus syriacus]|uniref:uncharacterized protein LOC120120892 n=1 Tax=Hibiscus syriacus TaxID=106335 RepID=UPI00192427DA|nr:uncharacterized protein LOC120120892 [Hibiscus syriacus]